MSSNYVDLFLWNSGFENKYVYKLNSAIEKISR